MNSEVNKNKELLNEDALEQVSGGFEIVGGKAVSSAGCRCGSAPEEMVLNSVTYDPDTDKTRCRFLCSQCGRPLNYYRSGDRTAEIRPFIIP